MRIAGERNRHTSTPMHKRKAASPQDGVRRHFAGRPVNVEGLLKAKCRALRESIRQKKYRQEQAS